MDNIDVLPKGKAEKRKRLALMKIWTTETSYPNKGWTTRTHSSKYSWKTQMSSPNNSWTIQMSSANGKLDNTNVQLSKFQEDASCMNQTYLRRGTIRIHYNCKIYFENKSYNPAAQNISNKTTYISVYTYVIQGFFSLNLSVSFSTQKYVCKNIRHENLEI